MSKIVDYDTPKTQKKISRKIWPLLEEQIIRIYFAMLHYITHFLVDYSAVCLQIEMFNLEGSH